MSRFDFDGDGEEYPGEYALFEANIDRALAGKRGQAILREMKAALEALPHKRLCQGRLADDGEVCVLGALCVKRLRDTGLTFEEAVEKAEREYAEMDAQALADTAGSRMKLGFHLAWKTMYANDELGENYKSKTTPEKRFENVMNWINSNLKL